MIKTVDLDESLTLDDYELYANLIIPINELRKEAKKLIPKVQNHKVWMINSTAQGGGVAEMLPRLLSILRELGLNIEWGVIKTEEQGFFKLTKKIHNLIHGQGEAFFSEEETALFEKVNRENAKHFLNLLNPEDIVIIHDPQPIAMVHTLKEAMPDLRVIWRCHIGLGKKTPQTTAVWKFLQPYLEKYDHSIFTASEYIPDYISGNVSIIHPSIAPLSHKNRYLSLEKLAGILQNAGLDPDGHEAVAPPFTHGVKRLQPNGKPGSPSLPAGIDLLYTPTITQISRWDRLKGFRPLLEAFAYLKKNLNQHTYQSERHKRTLEVMCLVLGGPDPDYVKDDPEGQEVFNELSDFYQKLPEPIQKQIAILQLPMQSAKENALIVNALQRSSALVVQNSLQEGFGLTVTEAMWKIVPVLGSKAVGIRQQIRDGIDGRLVANAQDPEEVGQTLLEVLGKPKELEVYVQNAQKRVLNDFLVFTQARKYLNLCCEVIS